MLDQKKARELAYEFSDLAEGIIGTILDAIMAFPLWADKIQEIQLTSVRSHGFTLQELDELKFKFGTGESGQPPSIHWHVPTQGEVKNRNQKGGRNTFFVSRMGLVAIYGYWEDYYREAIATALGQKKNSLKADIFYDLNKIRQSIVHHRGLAKKELETMKVLPAIPENSEINPAPEFLIQIRDEINEYLSVLVE